MICLYSEILKFKSYIINSICQMFFNKSKICLYLLVNLLLNRESFTHALIKQIKNNLDQNHYNNQYKINNQF